MNQDSNPSRSLRVMISSTVRDLAEYRAAVSEVLEGLRMHPVKMELLGADPATPLEVSLQLVEQADLYVAVLAHRYGSLPPGCDQSFTELEYEKAREFGRLCFIFMPSDEVRVFPADVETGEGAAKLQALKSRLLMEHKVSFFEDVGDFKYRLRLSLDQYLGSSQPAVHARQPVFGAGDRTIRSLDLEMKELSVEARIREFERQVRQNSLDRAYDAYWRWIDQPLRFGEWRCTERIRLLKMLLDPEIDSSVGTSLRRQRSFLLHSLGLAELDAGSPLDAVTRFAQALSSGLGVNSAEDRVASQCGLAEGLISLGRLKEACDLLESLQHDSETGGRRKGDELLLVSRRLALMMKHGEQKDLPSQPTPSSRDRSFRKDFLVHRARAEHELSMVMREDSWLLDRVRALSSFQSTANQRDIAARAAWHAKKYLYRENGAVRRLSALDRVRGERLLGFARTLHDSPQDRLEGQAALRKAEWTARELGFVEERLACQLGLARAARLDLRPEEEQRILSGLLADAGQHCLRLLQADAFNALALSSWLAGQADAAKSSALQAYECSWCDGPPYAYSWGLQLAQRLLERLAQSPKHPMINSQSRSGEDKNDAKFAGD